MGKVLLIGNDINNATSSYSWSDLLDSLLDFAHLEIWPDKANKPFPMLYEEIYLNAARSNSIKKISLKEFIASKTAKLEPNQIHERVMASEKEVILTTNYDLTFEKCMGAEQKRLSNGGYIRETLYSLFRVHQLEDKTIWHIHGSEITPRSITLGYEHYSGYLQQMRNYIASGTRGTYKKKDFLPIAQRIETGPLEHFSWVDYFFTDDVHIFGLNLDFVEMHLWWLLTYRARLIVEKRIPLSNKIYYYIPSNLVGSSKPKLDLLKVNGVECISLSTKGSDKLNYYNDVLDQIEKSN
jgi:hypothetical protein